MICQNPYCKAKFTPKYPGQSVCSASCGAVVLRLKNQERRDKAKQSYRVGEEKFKAKPKVKIPLVGPRRKEQIKIYTELKPKWFALPENQVCACRKVLGCCKPGTRLVVHHMAGRYQWWLCYTKYWIPVCNDAHEKITQDSEWAFKQGYSIKRSNTERISFEEHIKPLL